MQFALVSLAVATMSLAPAKADAPTLATVTVKVHVGGENKEKPCSYEVIVKHQSKEIFKKSGWGKDEDWEDTTKQATSTNLSSLNLPAKGKYVIEVHMDQGNNCDVNHQWWVEVEDDQGDEYESEKGPSGTWENDVTSAEYSVRVKEPKK